MEKLFILCLFLQITSLFGYGQSLSVLIAPVGPVEALVGSTISLNCTINSASTKSALTWHIPPNPFGQKGGHRYSEDWKSPNVLVLTIKAVQPEDTGTFMCRSKQYGESYVTLNVYDPRINSTKQCAPSQYRCPDGYCIFHRYRCDYVTDCSDGSDELNCDFSCDEESEWRCDNGQCINKDFVCDKFQSADCRDSSDEKDCGRIKYGDEVDQDEPDVTLTPHRWHFNAIYSGIASLIGVACISAIIVITLCRIHMRREAMRHGSRYQEYLNHRNINNGADVNRPYPWLRRATHQQQQQQLNNTTLSHISEDGDLDIVPYRCPGQTNLNVNINLRLTPQGEPEFINVISKPPSYSELENIAEPPPREGTPPPPYSTLPFSAHRDDNNTTERGDETDDAVPSYDSVLASAVDDYGVLLLINGTGASDTGHSSNVNTIAGRPQGNCDTAMQQEPLLGPLSSNNRREGYTPNGAKNS